MSNRRFGAAGRVHNMYSHDERIPVTFPQFFTTVALTYLAVVVFDSRCFVFGCNVIADVASLQDDGTGGSTTSYGDDGEIQPGERFGDTFGFKLPPSLPCSTSTRYAIWTVAGLSSPIFCALVPVGANLLLTRTSGFEC